MSERKWLLWAGEMMMPIEKIQTVKDKYKDIDGCLIKDLRNVIAHDYPGIDLDMIWDTVRIDIPALEKDIQRVYKNEDR